MEELIVYSKDKANGFSYITIYCKRKNSHEVNKMSSWYKYHDDGKDSFCGRLGSPKTMNFEEALDDIANLFKSDSDVNILKSTWDSNNMDLLFSKIDG